MNRYGRYIEWARLCTRTLNARWNTLKDLALPEERELLDRLTAICPAYGPLKITKRDGPEFGQFHTVATAAYCSLGCYVIDVSWIRKTVRKARRDESRRRRKLAARIRGAYI